MNKNMFKKAWLVWFLIFCAPIAAFPAAAETNLNSIKLIFAQMLDEILGSKSYQTITLLYAPAGQDQGYNWLIEEQINRAADRYKFAGIYSRSNPAQGDSGKYIQLSYRPIDLKIEYEKSKDSPGVLSRNIHCELYLQLVNENGQVLFSNSNIKNYADTIDPKQMDSIENANFVFTHGQKSGKSAFGKFLEPAMITVLTGGIVYSFYSFRSK
jgi:hypothetical protein